MNRMIRNTSRVLARQWVFVWMCLVAASPSLASTLVHAFTPSPLSIAAAAAATTTITTTTLDLQPPSSILLGPPAGAIYQKVLQIPVLGRQCFRLSILGNGRAHLQVSGMMQIDETLDYQVRQCDGSFSLLLSDRIHKVLRRFRTKMVDFGYDEVKDLPYVIVSPPLPTNIHFHLEREYGSIRRDDLEQPSHVLY
jgi:hypothetical protein